jgi:hypothetical protein
MSGDFGFDAAKGLPEQLPRGERLLWQGGPDWKRLAVDAFHARKVIYYFAALAGLQALGKLATGSALDAALRPLLWLAPMALVASLILIGLAWLSARTTVYTLTSKRLVMRIGMALPITINIPFKLIDGAAVKVNGDGTGDIPLALHDGEHIAYLALWPHARRWHFSRPQPSLRSVPNADRIANLLAKALAGEAVQPELTQSEPAGHQLAAAAA